MTSSLSTTPKANLRVGFSTTSNPLSALIRLVTGAKCSHTFLVYADPLLGVDMVIEASEWGVQEVKLAYFAKRNRLVAVADLDSSIDYTPGLHLAAQWLQERYDFGGLFGMAFVALGRHLKRVIRNPWSSAKAVFCSELVVKVLQSVSYPGTLDLTADDVEPEDLFLLLVKN